MIQSIADFLRIPEDAFAQLGCFNGFVNQDAPLFLSPYLLKQYRQGDFEAAYGSVVSHITRILDLLKESNGQDAHWLEAFNTLKYQEVREIGLGYSRLSIRGRQPSQNVRARFLSGLRNLVRMNVDDPEHMSAVTIFEDHLGPDQMSDLLASIIKRHIARYTQTMLLLMGVDRSRLRRWRLRKETVFLPEHPFCKGKPILLLPTAILSSLPKISTARQLPALFDPKSKARLELRSLIVGVSRTIQKADRTAAINAKLAARPELLRDILKRFGNQLSSSYDFARDPGGVISWYADAKEMLALPRNPSGPAHVFTEEDMRDFLRGTITYLKDLFEKKGYWRNLYRTRRETGDEPLPLRENSINWLLAMLLERECREAGLDLSPTPSLGSGEPDFKISTGLVKGLVEVKRLSHNKLISGAPEQIREYAASERFALAILLVVNNGGEPARLDQLRVKLASPEFRELNIEEAYIDASQRSTPAVQKSKTSK